MSEIDLLYHILAALLDPTLSATTRAQIEQQARHLLSIRARKEPQ